MGTLGPGPNRAAIRTRGLRRAYGERDAVAGVHLDVAPGEIFAFLGPNGAGETTTVEILDLAEHGDVPSSASRGASAAGSRWPSR